MNNSDRQIKIRTRLREIERRLERLSKAPRYSLSNDKKLIIYALSDITIEARENEITIFNKRIDKLKEVTWKLMGL